MRKPLKDAVGLRTWILTTRAVLGLEPRKVEVKADDDVRIGSQAGEETTEFAAYPFTTPLAGWPSGKRY